LEFISTTNGQLFILAYLVGGIPFGLILAKLYGGVDIRDQGSGNIGATNVLRVLKEKDPTLAKRLGAITLALDSLKGVLVLAIASIIGVSEATLWGIAVLSVIGHCFSPFLWFEGGKGVATGFGVLVFIIPYATLIGLVMWFISAKIIKISSLSSLIGVISTLIGSFIIYPSITHAPVVLIVFFIIYKHGNNIINLIKGKERRVV
jgi:glycerol-3-phosphate acyltransferase PlsY